MGNIVDKTADMTSVRDAAALFNDLPRDSRDVIRMPILRDETLAYYRGGYNAALFAKAIAIGHGAEADHIESVKRLSWGYAAEIVRIVDVAAANDHNNNAGKSVK